MTVTLRELQDAYDAQDKLCTELIKAEPMGYHDNEFDKIVFLKEEIRGYSEALLFVHEKIDELKKFANDAEREVLDTVLAEIESGETVYQVNMDKINEIKRRANNG